MVVCGGLARLFSLVAVGVPSRGHLFGLGMELGVVPLLMLWQWRVARPSPGRGDAQPRIAADGGGGPQAAVA